MEEPMSQNTPRDPAYYCPHHGEVEPDLYTGVPLCPWCFDGLQRVYPVAPSAKPVPDPTWDSLDDAMREERRFGFGDYRGSRHK
jgi:hypothetical protein